MSNKCKIRIKPDYGLSLLSEFGWRKIDKEEEGMKDDNKLSIFDYSLDLGHSRRGQSYYLLIKEKDRVIHLYATKPDGGGGSIMMHPVLLLMRDAGVIEIIDDELFSTLPF